MADREHREAEEHRRVERERELLRAASTQLGRVSRTLHFADLMALMMVAATAFSAYAAWRTARVTSLLFTVSERPFLGVQKVSFEAGRSDVPAIVVEYRNFGHIPAVDTTVGVRALLDGKLIQPPGNQVTVENAGIVSPTVPHYFYAFIPVDAYKKALDGSANLMVHIKMQYQGPGEGVRYCYFEKLLYFSQVDAFRLSGGTAGCSGGDTSDAY